MTTTTIEVLGVRATAAPRGAGIAASLFVRAAGWLLKAPAHGDSSAATRARESAHVRDLARRIQGTDPGFAADLFAAADRHDSVF